jgi:Na+-translocating ferredoxin:NAD+ oxidoreductase subunit C
VLRTLGFRGGILPPSDKVPTAQSAIEELPPPSRVIIPVLQHAGSAASLLVRRGDRVRLGQVIAEPAGHNSAAVHSSVSGIVLSVSKFPHPNGERVLAAEIENDGQDSSVDMRPLEKPWSEAAPVEIVQKIRECGIVGMGGEGVPAHVKLSLPAGKPVDTFIVNCTECEPLMTADARLVMEKCGDVLTGALIIKKILGAGKAAIAADAGAPGVMAALSQALKDARFKDIHCSPTKTKYPQSEEKILVKTLTRREVSSGSTPADVGCMVQNAATVYAIAQSVMAGVPLYRRVVTVAGPCIASPKNLLVRIGTPLKQVLEHCGADMKAAKKIIMGGPMRGLAQAELDTPVIKTTRGIVALSELFPGVRQYDCIGCGRCMRACPMRLLPAFLMRFVDKGKTAKAVEWGIGTCIECGSCAYVCPSKINLVHFMKLGKYRAVSGGGQQAPAPTADGKAS